MNIHYIRHEPFEGLVCIEDWIKKNGHTISVTKTYESPTFPSLDSFDWLIVMGGAISAYNDDKVPWLGAEKAFIRQSVHAGKRVLGICLGAQLIASALGAKVYPNTEKEIGWFPIHLTPAAKGHPLFVGIPDKLTVFHWHGDTFDLPEGAVRLASSVVTPNQAFAVGEKVLALQFHYEATAESILDMTTGCGADLTPGPWVQDVDTMRAMAHLAETNNRIMFGILDRLAGQAISQ